MRRLRHILLATLGLFALSACHNEESGSSFVGLGTVELNDTVFAIHYYSYTLNITEAGWQKDLTDGARVYFTGTGYSFYYDGDYTTCTFSPKSITSDLTREIVYFNGDSLGADTLAKVVYSAEGFYGQNIHITRDWRRNDYLDAMCTYPGTGDGSSDFFGLVRDTTEIEADTLLVFWLRLCRAQSDSLVYINKHVSVPFTCVQDSTKERVYIRLKRLNADGDTLMTDYVYSYINWID